MARLGPFEIGQIKAHLHHGLGPTAIAGLVKKADGTNVSPQAVCDAKAKLEGDPAWRGERALGSGAPRKTDERTDSAIAREVFRARGRAKATVAYLKKKFPRLRALSDTLVEERLHAPRQGWPRNRETVPSACNMCLGTKSICRRWYHISKKLVSSIVPT